MKKFLALIFFMMATPARTMDKIITIDNAQSIAAIGLSLYAIHKNNQIDTYFKNQIILHPQLAHKYSKFDAEIVPIAGIISLTGAVTGYQSAACMIALLIAEAALLRSNTVDEMVQACITEEFTAQKNALDRRKGLHIPLRNEK